MGLDKTRTHAKPAMGASSAMDVDQTGVRVSDEAVGVSELDPNAYVVLHPNTTLTVNGHYDTGSKKEVPVSPTLFDHMTK